MKYLVILLVAFALAGPAYADRSGAISSADRMADTLDLIAEGANQEARASDGRGQTTRARYLRRYALISQQISGTLQGRIVWALRDGVDMRSVRERYARMKYKFREWNDAYGDVRSMPRQITSRQLLVKRLYAQTREELNEQ